EQAALEAEKEFNRVFKEKKTPSKIPSIFIKQKELNILDFLVKAKLAFSRSEAKRLVEQGGVKIGGEVQTDWQKLVKIKKGEVVRVGKRKFLKIK
ncbi:MAG: S4 domain-containing protein, partial [Patescibacteria group bacterium]